MLSWRNRVPDCDDGGSGRIQLPRRLAEERSLSLDDSGCRAIVHSQIPVTAVFNRCKTREPIILNRHHSAVTGRSTLPTVGQRTKVTCDAFSHMGRKTPIRKWPTGTSSGHCSANRCIEIVALRPTSARGGVQPRPAIWPQVNECL